MVFGKKKAEPPVVLTEEELKVIPTDALEDYKNMKDKYPETAEGMLNHFRQKADESRTPEVPPVPEPPQMEEKKEDQKEVQVVTEFQLINYKLDAILERLDRK